MQDLRDFMLGIVSSGGLVLLVTLFKSI
jgi:hypothetical protein